MSDAKLESIMSEDVEKSEETTSNSDSGFTTSSASGSTVLTKVRYLINFIDGLSQTLED